MPSMEIRVITINYKDLRTKIDLQTHLLYKGFMKIQFN